MNNKPVRVRIAPSPTGNLHIGTARLALWNYLFAKKNNGTLILRIEDTDKERSKKEYENNIVESLDWLGIKYDEFYRQSERTEIYKKYLQKLLDEGKIYVSKEEVKEEGDRAEVIRFKNPNVKITFTDLIRGDITMDTTDLGDFVIAKSLEEPIFHFVVVIDDFEMGITHILRGEDHIPNTPRHILIQQAIGAVTPLYAHLPMVLSPDRSKMSKRHGPVSLTEYREKGYLSKALINFLALLGWNPGTEQEIFSLEELIKLFDLAQVNKAGAIFNIEKLNWFNREYILKLTTDEIKNEIKSRGGVVDDNLALKLIPIVLDRISILGDIDNMKESGELDYFSNSPTYEKSLLYWKEIKDDKITIEHLLKVKEILSREIEWNAENIKKSLWDYASSAGRGNVLWPLRVALTGREKSPDPFIVASIIDKEQTLLRIEKAINILNT